MLSLHSAIAEETQASSGYPRDCSIFDKSNEALAAVKKFQVSTYANVSADDRHNLDYIIDNKMVFKRTTDAPEWTTEPYKTQISQIFGEPVHSDCRREEEKIISGNLYAIYFYVYKELRKGKIASYSCNISIDTKTLLPFERSCLSLNPGGFPRFTTRWSYRADTQAPTLPPGP
jgi:hypothetical protein